MPEPWTGCLSAAISRPATGAVLMALLAPCAIATDLPHVRQVIGTVFVDMDGDGRRNANEPGLAGVAVSNGREVALTDATGGYVLPEEAAATVFVIKPRGYRLPETADHRPRFHFALPPSAGSAGDPADGRDFPLLPGAAEDRFSVLVFADPQLNNQAAAGYLDRGIIQSLAGTRHYRFGITLGDIVWDDLSLFPTAAAIFGRIGIPWFNVVGNHDLDLGAPFPEMADDEFERMFGPSHYAFNEGRVHFLVLNSSRIRPGKPKLRYEIGLTERQFQFIERDLAHVSQDQLVVVALHHALFSAQRGGIVLPAPQRARLFRLMGRFPHTLSLSGHSHFQSRWHLGANDDWPGQSPHEHLNVGTASGDWWAGKPTPAGLPDAMMRDGTPPGYASLHFDGARYRIEYTCTGTDAPAQFHVDGPERVSAAAAPSFLYVNYYLGSSRTRVDFRHAGGEWQAFERVFEMDPVRVRKYEEWVPGPKATAGFRPSPPFLSTHLWKAALPQEGPFGPRSLEVRIRTEEGEELLAAYRYDVVP